MVVNRSVSSAIAVLLAATALGCSDPGEPEVVTRVEIIGAIRTVGVGQSIQFEGRAATNTGARVDDLISWSVSPTGVISVSAELVTVGGSVVNRATVTGLSAGGADLIATAGGQSASVRISTSGPQP